MLRSLIGMPCHCFFEPSLPSGFVFYNDQASDLAACEHTNDEIKSRLTIQPSTHVDPVIEHLYRPIGDDGTTRSPEASTIPTPSESGTPASVPTTHGHPLFEYVDRPVGDEETPGIPEASTPPKPLESGPLASEPKSHGHLKHEHVGRVMNADETSGTRKASAIPNTSIFRPSPSLCTDVLLDICERLPTRDLLRFSAANRFARSTSNLTMRARLHSLLNPFLEPHTDEILKYMSEHDIYVVGSLVLAFLNGRHFPLDDADLDLLVTSYEADGLVSILKTMAGYGLDATKVDFSGEAGLARRTTTTTHIPLRRNDRKIDIIAVKAPTPLVVLPFFWSTCLMNAINLNHLFVLYPTLTLERRGLIHTHYLRQPTSYRSIEPLKKKYEERGYTQSDELACNVQLLDIDLPPVRLCSKSVSRIEPRLTSDKYTLHVVFDDDPLSRRESRCAEEWDTAWRLGGIGKSGPGRVPFLISFRCHSTPRHMPVL